jgi:FixJ family two-component response regulator
MPPLPRIAVLDDEPAFRQALTRLLRTHGFEVACFATPHEMATSLSVMRFDCLLLDLHMPGINGFDVLRLMRQQGLQVPVIVFTGHDKTETADLARSLGVSSFLLKPLDQATLLAAIARAVPHLPPSASGTPSSTPENASPSRRSATSS